MRFAGLIVAAMAGTAQAHPGPHAKEALLHFLTEPDHLAALLLPMAIGIVGLWRFLRRRRASAR
jgi:hypothetical protein